MDVKNGIIQQVKIFVDFFASRPIEELEEKLVGVPHETENLRKILSSLDLTTLGR